ncbi:MAG TPA: peptidoglycan editing factor PgeF [Candidatus Binatia bacterium]|nr:peptidoglycan editing factor PgeF [Candidatus Binatia bacterium]
MSEIPALSVAGWRDVPGLIHGFLGRRGGVSVGEYASLNLSERVHDDPSAVAENRRRVAASSAARGRMVFMQQVHGDHIVRVDSPTQSVGASDGLISSTAGALLGVLTADCVPLLLVARRHRAAAAIHAGWRGTLAGIAVRAVEIFRTVYGAEAVELEAALGPAIGGCCYEVEREIGDRFASQWGTLSGEGWRPRGTKGFLDLRVANRHLLLRSGVPAPAIHFVGPCTRCSTAEYFSHRSAAKETGRQLSYVGWGSVE